MEIHILIPLLLLAEVGTLDNILLNDARYQPGYIESRDYDRILDVCYFDQGDGIAVLGVRDQVYQVVLYGGSSSPNHSAEFESDGAASCICEYASLEEEAIAVAVSRGDSILMEIWTPVNEDLSDWGNVEEYLLPLSRLPSAMYQVDDDAFVLVSGFMDTERMVAGYDVALWRIPSPGDSVPDENTQGWDTPFMHEELPFADIGELYTILLDAPRIAVSRDMPASRLYVATASREEYLIRCFDLLTGEELDGCYSRPTRIDSLGVYFRDDQFTGLFVDTLCKDSLELAYERASAVGISDQLSDWEPQPLRRMIRSLAVSPDGELWVERGTAEIPTIDRFDESGMCIRSYVLESCDRMESSSDQVPWSPEPWQISFTVDNEHNIVAFSLHEPPSNIYMLRASGD